jgi:hypothetical protein
MGRAVDRLASRPSRRARMVLVASLVLAATTRGKAAPTPLLAVEVETVQIATDGSVRRGCQDQDQVEAGKKRELWIVYGGVKAHAERGWEALTPRTHCGSGSFEEASSHLGRMLGIRTSRALADVDGAGVVVGKGDASARQAPAIALRWGPGLYVQRREADFVGTGLVPGLAVVDVDFAVLIHVVAARDRDTQINTGVADTAGRIGRADQGYIVRASARAERRRGQLREDRTSG